MAERIVSKLVENGMGRQTAYKIVRDCAIKSIKENLPFFKIVEENPEIKKYLSSEEVKRINGSSHIHRTCSEITDKVVKPLKRS